MTEETTRRLTLLSRASEQAVDSKGEASEQAPVGDLSAERCQQILNAAGGARIYSLHEAEQIRDALCRIAKIHILHIEEASRDEEGNTLYPRQYRRAS